MGSERRRGPFLTQTPNPICPEALCPPAPLQGATELGSKRLRHPCVVLCPVAMPAFLSFLLTHSVLIDGLLKLDQSLRCPPLYLNSYHLVLMDVEKIARFWRKGGIFWRGVGLTSPFGGV